jgi:hypothetical protein
MKPDNTIAHPAAHIFSLGATVSEARKGVYDSRTLDWHELPGLQPQRGAHWQAEVQGGRDGSATVGIAKPPRLTAGLFKVSTLATHARCPAFYMGGCSQSVALVVVAPGMGSHQVVQPVVAKPRPRYEVVDIRTPYDSAVAIEAEAILEVEQGRTNRIEWNSFSPEEKFFQFSLVQIVRTGHHHGPVAPKERTKQSGKAHKVFGHAGP